MEYENFSEKDRIEILKLAVDLVECMDGPEEIEDVERVYRRMIKLVTDPLE